MNAYCYSSIILFLLQVLQSGAVFNITASEPLLQNQTLLSNSQIFELGFFTPSRSQNQYIGIWYKNMTPSKVVWVANRDQPLASTDQSASLMIGSDGNLKLLDGQQSLVWSTNVTVSNYSVATLSDYGNFVLQDGNSNEIWGSFDEPTDALFPNMKLGINVKTGKKAYLVSWKSENDPSSGSFVVGITPETPPQAFTWNGSTPHWRGGQWDKSTFVGISDMDNTYMSGFSLQQDIQQGTTYFILNNYNYNNSFFGYVFISSNGSLKLVNWDDGTDKWLTNWEAPTNLCEIYGTCGPFGVCNSLKLPICRCLEGFKPRSNEEWNRENWTGGCIRETELNCKRNTSTSAPVTVKEDIFLEMSQMKLPDSSNYLSDIADAEECQSWCLSNCSCLAYSYVNTIGCMVWSDELIDIEQFTTAGEDLFIRLAHAALSKQTKMIISLSTILGITFCGAAIYGLCKWRANKRGDTTDRSEEVQNAWKEQWRQDNGSELTLFSFDSILLVTNNFNTSNKLGQGGFGPVYKGKLKDGKEIAVKRLSSSSAQGMEEFKNEILLISKLQHRNLVRLLGCCSEGEEKILVYEYLSNKSLDAFLFDSRKKVELSWDIRFHIIQGVARGLLYLHRDSCLRIIHRDLKVSNILLNEKMDPKISDFGLARMFEGTQFLVNTHKVVGTLGYMSPEYAMGGIFSEKSDVYSFGVLLLEVVSGRKNTSLDYHSQHLNLLIYAWQLWSGGRALDLTDEAIAAAFSPSEVIRCIHVGLLCVQDHAVDRPNMSQVVLMLSSESDLPQPKQPTFTFESLTTPEIRSSQRESNLSANTITNTVVQGR